MKNDLVENDGYSFNYKFLSRSGIQLSTWGTPAWVTHRPVCHQRMTEWWQRLAGHTWGNCNPWRRRPPLHGQTASLCNPLKKTSAGGEREVRVRTCQPFSLCEKKRENKSVASYRCQGGWFGSSWRRPVWHVHGSSAHRTESVRSSSGICSPGWPVYLWCCLHGGPVESQVPILQSKMSGPLKYFISIFFPKKDYFVNIRSLDEWTLFHRSPTCRGWSPSFSWDP